MRMGLAEFAEGDLHHAAAKLGENPVRGHRDHEPGDIRVPNAATQVQRQQGQDGSQWNLDAAPCAVCRRQCARSIHNHIGLGRCGRSVDGRSWRDARRRRFRTVGVMFRHEVLEESKKLEFHIREMALLVDYGLKFMPGLASGLSETTAHLYRSAWHSW